MRVQPWVLILVKEAEDSQWRPIAVVKYTEASFSTISVPPVAILPSPILLSFLSQDAQPEGEYSFFTIINEKRSSGYSRQAHISMK